MTMTPSNAPYYKNIIYFISLLYMLVLLINYDKFIIHYAYIQKI